MIQAVAAEFERFVAAERRARRLPMAARRTDEGRVFRPVCIPARLGTLLMRVAARRAAGLTRATPNDEVVWVQGGNELAVCIASIGVKLGDGLLRVLIPVRCDQVDHATVEVLLATGSPTEPAGLYAATARRPNGPELIATVWGDALVAFAWHCLLELVTGVAAATGKDRRGDRLVPVELAVSAEAIQIVPMARHRFSGSPPIKGQR